MERLRREKLTHPPQNPKEKDFQAFEGKLRTLQQSLLPTSLPGEKGVVAGSGPAPCTSPLTRGTKLAQAFPPHFHDIDL